MDRYEFMRQQRKDFLYERLEQVKENTEGGIELGREMDDLLFIALVGIGGREELDRYQGEIDSIESEELRESEWEDHWLFT